MNKNEILTPRSKVLQAHVQNMAIDFLMQYIVKNLSCASLLHTKLDCTWHEKFTVVIIFK